MKIKLNQIRTYDSAGFRRRAACLCFKSECETEVLLVTSSRFQDLWVVPGGGLEPGEDPRATAIREVKEEAGVVGRLGRLLDVFENEERNTRTYVYVMVVEALHDDYEDLKDIGRLRKWFTIEEANQKLSEHKPVQKLYLQKLVCDQEHQRRTASHCKTQCYHFSSQQQQRDQHCLSPVVNGDYENDRTAEENNANGRNANCDSDEATAADKALSACKLHITANIWSEPSMNIRVDDATEQRGVKSKS